MGSASATAALSVAMLVCANASAQAAETFKLANGIELPLLPGVKRQAACEGMGQKFPDVPGNVCLEYPRELALKGKGEDVQNQYVRLLTARGFTFEGAVSIQYWLRWPACPARFTLSGMPKSLPPGEQDWLRAETFMMVMGFERPGCEEKTP